MTGGQQPAKFPCPRHRYKAGKVTRNPFLNFLRDFRKANAALKVTELTRRGAEVWRAMNDRQKSPYCHQARQAPRRGRRRRRRRCSGCRRRRSSAAAAASSTCSSSGSGGGGRGGSDAEPAAACQGQQAKAPSARVVRPSRSRHDPDDLLA